MDQYLRSPVAALVTASLERAPVQLTTNAGCRADVKALLSLLSSQLQQRSVCRGARKISTAVGLRLTKMVSTLVFIVHTPNFLVNYGVQF